MNSDQTAKMVGSNSTPPGERIDRTKQIAIWVAVFAAVAAGFSAFLNYKRNEYEIKSKVFDVHVENNWRVLIEQIGGPLYQIQTVTLTPTFQERRGDTAAYVDGGHIEIPLRQLEARTNDGLTRYEIDNLQSRLCPPHTQQPKLLSPCLNTALWRLEIKFDVSGDTRTYICRPNQCISS